MRGKKKVEPKEYLNTGLTYKQYKQKINDVVDDLVFQMALNGISPIISLPDISDELIRRVERVNEYKKEQLEKEGKENDTVQKRI